jgi:hypothetical protein
MITTLMAMTLTRACEEIDRKGNIGPIGKIPDCEEAE